MHGMRSRYWIAAFLVLALGAGCGRGGGRARNAGFRELQRGRHVRALTFFERAIHRNPEGREGALAWNGIGVTYARLGERERAIEAFETSHRLYPDAGAPLYNLGVLLGKNGDSTEAFAALLKAAFHRPDDPIPLEYLAHLYLAGGLNDAAADRLRQALDRQPVSPRILTALGVSEWRKQGPGAGLRYFMQALEQDDRYAPALYNLFVLWDRALNRPAEASGFGHRFLATGASPARAAAVRVRLETIDAQRSPPSRADTLPLSAPPSADKPAPVESPYERWMSEARALAGRGLPSAEAALRAAEEAHRSGDPVARERAYRFALDQAFDQPAVQAAWGLYQMENERFAEARASFQRALALDAANPRAHWGMGLLAVQAREFDAALVHLRSAIEADPTVSDAQWALAELFDQSLGISREALREYRVFEQRFPSDPRRVVAQRRVRELAVRAPDTDPVRPSGASPAADEAWPSLLGEPASEPRRDSRQAREAYARGVRFQERRANDQAESEYRLALELDPHMTVALYNLATLLAERGAEEEARSAYYAVLEQDRNHAAARYNLALLYQGRGDHRRALSHVEYLLEAHPDHAQGWYLAGIIHSGRPGETAAARRCFQRFLERAPNDPLADPVRRWLDSHP